MSMRDGYMWTIKNQSGFLLDIHLRYERTNTIKDFVKWMDYKDWRYWKRRGFKCVRVIVIEVKE